MSDPNADRAPNPDGGDSPPRLRFVTARPDTKQGRREAKAAIRAHASQASWARIKKKGRQQQTPDAIAHIGASSSTTERRKSSASEPPTDQRGSGSSAGPREDDGAVSSRQVVPARFVRHDILDSISVPSPLRAVGAGDVDPFVSYPSRLPKEVVAPIMDQANNFLNIMLLPDPGRPDQSVVPSWRAWYMSDSTLFHASFFAQLSRMSTAEAELKPVYRRAYWYCYSVVVQEINRRFNDPSQQCSDESIHAVQALAFHGEKVAADADTPRSPSQGPMNSMQGLDIYAGRLNPVNMHVNGMGRMVAMRGGIGDVKFPGLGAMLSYGDVLLASRTLQRPVYPFVPLGESPRRTLAAVSRREHPLAQLGTGFQILRDLLPDEDAHALWFSLHALSIYSLAVDDYIMGRPQAPTLGTLADQRNFVQHGLMSLRSTPDQLEAESGPDTFLLQEACWAAAAIYSLIAVFPIPHANAPFAQLAHLLKEHLVDTSAHFSRRWQKPSQLVLWMTFMGALASTTNDDDSKAVKAWYVAVLERLVHRMQILSWERLKDVLLRFLWFPSTSDTDGQQLWREIHTSNPFT